MSTLRPGAVQDPDTSFEEIDTTIEVGREMKHHKTEGPSGDDMKPQLPKLLPPLTKGYMEPTVPSTISSPGSTTLSGKDNNRFSTYTESDGQEFLEDFEEFDSEKKVDQWLQMKDQDFDLESYKEDDEDDGLSELRSELENRLAFGGVGGVNNDPLALTNDGSLGTGDTRPSISAKGDTLLLPPKRHQKRDQAFEAAKQRNARQHLPLSRSYMNLRPSGSSDETNDSRLRYKKSMPSLSHFKNNLIPECDERSKGEELFYYDDDNFAEGLGLDAKPSRRFDERKLKKSGLVTPQFIEDEDPLNLSPSQYTIIRDDTLLTPQLHRQQQKQKYNLDAFKEVDHRRKRNTHGKKSASYRLRTIKQEIDHNTPIRAGNMSYNPKLKKWEGNEEILERFKTLDSEETYRALLITKNASRESPTRARYSNSSRKNHGKVVGKMVFDEKNLRWLSLEGGEVDPFGDITETIKAKPLPLNYQSSKSVKFQRAQSQPAAANRAHSSSAHAPTRYHSFAQYNKSNPTFHISGKQLEKFYHEEQRWVRKIGGWFNSDDSDNTKNVKNRKGHNDQAYMYEIRNMVMNSARN